jgi:hypothetical protein
MQLSLVCGPEDGLTIQVTSFLWIGQNLGAGLRFSPVDAPFLPKIMLLLQLS